MDTTVISPLTLMLFGGEIRIFHDECYVLIDGWIRIRAPAPHAVLIRKLRQALDMLLKQKIEKPEADMALTSVGIVSALSKMLQDEENNLQWRT